MADQACLVDLGGAQFLWLPDVIGRNGFLMLCTRAVAGFAGFFFVNVLFKRFGDIFVAGGANLILRVMRSRHRRLGGEKKQRYGHHDRLGYRAWAGSPAWYVRYSGGRSRIGHGGGRLLEKVHTISHAPCPLKIRQYWSDRRRSFLQAK